MAIDFRCEHCGKLLSVEGEPSSKTKCPYCKASVTVPAGLASLPQPQIPADSDQAQPPPPEQPIEEQLAEPVGQDALMGVMAIVMPWVISLFFHISVIVILAFITIVMFKTTTRAEITVPDVPLSEQLGGRINPGQQQPELRAKSTSRTDNQWAKRDARIPMADLGQTKNKILLYGTAGGAAGGGPTAPFGLITGGEGAGPRSRFFGTGGNAYHIVYVVDRSGSMLDTFDEVRREILKSISRLSPQQTFHVIFFATGTPKENPPRRLVYANEAAKREALSFLKKINPEGQTDPIPAVKRAFAALGRSPGSRRGKLLYLLTDGEFPDNDKVCREIKALNAKGRVHINTILHHHRSPDVMKVLKRIARENKGVFKFVEASE